MKYALMATVEFDSKAKSDNLAQMVKDKIAGKMLWANAGNPNSVTNVVLENGNPGVSIMLRFDSKAERDEVAAYVQEKIDRLPALKGKVEKHRCFHDAGGRPCEPEGN